MRENIANTATRRDYAASGPFNVAEAMQEVARIEALSGGQN